MSTNQKKDTETKTGLSRAHRFELRIAADRQLELYRELADATKDRPDANEYWQSKVEKLKDAIDLIDP